MPGVGGRPFGFGGDDMPRQGNAGPRPVRPERTLVLIDARARHRVARPWQHLWRRRVRARRSGRDGRSRMIRGAFQHRWRRRRCTVREPGAVGVGELECRQPRAAPEVFRVDPALLERGVHPRLQDPVRQQIGQDNLEVWSRRDGPHPARRRIDLAGPETLSQVVLAATSTSLIERNCSSTGFRFGLSSIERPALGSRTQKCSAATRRWPVHVR